MMRGTILLIALVAGSGAAAADQSAGIPDRCSSPETDAHVMQVVPELLNLGPGAATISNVDRLADVPRAIYYPAAGNQPALRMLQCPVKLTWSNGKQEIGYFMEWEDGYQQVQASFTRQPVQPPRP